MLFYVYKDGGNTEKFNSTLGIIILYIMYFVTQPKQVDNISKYPYRYISIRLVIE